MNEVTDHAAEHDEETSVDINLDVVVLALLRLQYGEEYGQQHGDKSEDEPCDEVAGRPGAVDDGKNFSHFCLVLYLFVVYLLRQFTKGADFQAPLAKKR